MPRSATASIPDVTVLGKIIGGGFALAAFGGSAEVMRVEAENRVVHGGTYTGSPVALAAAAAVLQRIQSDAGLYDGLEHCSARLADGIEAAFAASRCRGSRAAGRLDAPAVPASASARAAVHTG